MTYFIVVWGREIDSPKSRPYSTYTAKDGRPLAFPSDNLWFDDCPTAATRTDLDNILSIDYQQQVVIFLEDIPQVLGWDDVALPGEEVVS